MQLKHLIIFALAGMVLLLGFNMINGNRYESRQAAALNNEISADSPIDNANSANLTDITSSSTNINSKPLGEQPKTILDKVNTQMDQTQQKDKARLEQIDSGQ
ncbi:hypothetical protein [Psychrobacter frigidicola]|uniref:hypothetical protein n=1 Tax=Psychrobacter frigidicola TaxID=45611 RepID=UPI00191A1FCA|nr:hypothetical protein [Psychrobacter frigidicola]